MSVEQPSQLSVLLCDPSSCKLDLSRGLDTLELVDSESLLQLLEIFSPSSPRSSLIISYPGKICLLLQIHDKS